MPAFTDRVGEVARAKNGLLMRIIAYRRNTDIDIEFEDGCIVYNKSYQSFKNGYIKHPNYNEYTLRIININKEERILKAKSKYLGKIERMSNGMLAEIIDYRSYTDIDVRFEDGTVVKNKQMASFLSGKIGNPNFKSPYLFEVGDIVVSSCGFRVKLIDYQCSTVKCKVLFEDGSLKDMWYHGFCKGKIIHEGFNNSKGSCKASKYLAFKGLKEAFRVKGKVFYYCIDGEGVGNILTPQQMMEQSGVKSVF